MPRSLLRSSSGPRDPSNAPPIPGQSPLSFFRPPPIISRYILRVKKVRFGPKPALISWMEQRGEGWSRVPLYPNWFSRAFKAPMESPEVLVGRNTDLAISVASAWDSHPQVLPGTRPQEHSPRRPCPAWMLRRPAAHVCTDCGRRFTYPSLLVSHRRMHSGSGPSPALSVGMRFKRKFAVEAHQWPGIRAVPRAPVRGDRDPPVLFRHYPDIFEECG
uniref:Zinc finger protein 688 n=1 Tax=Aotus nancymaae TaxID=37293 RepID=A0A2K5D4W3_AOTNA